MITVKNLIIHEIIKNEREISKADHVLSTDLLPIEENTIALVEQLEKSYNTASLTNAIFDEDKTNPLKKIPQFYIDYKDSNNLEFDFLTFTQEATKNLKSWINPVSGAKGGYLIYVEYHNRHDFLAVFLVRNRRGSKFSYNPSKRVFEVGDSIYIDVDHLAMAARVNISLYGSINRYISFINKAHNDSKFFLNWFCAFEKVSNVEDTKTLKYILLNIDRPKGDDGNQIGEHEFLNKVNSYIRALPKEEMVNLKTLGSVFYEDPDRFTNYLNDNDLIMNHEFRADRGVLRTFVNIIAKADKISLNFPLNYLDDGIIVIEGDKVIIKSPKLVQKLEAEQNDNE